MTSISGPYNLNASRELGQTINNWSKNTGSVEDKQDVLVDASTTINAQDLEGALKAKDGSLGAGDTIYLKTKGQILAVDVSENKAMLDQLLKDVKGGKTVRLADLNLAVLDNKRATNLEFGLNTDHLEAMSKAGENTTDAKAAKVIQDVWKGFEETGLRDGTRLSDAQKLNLAVNALKDNQFTDAEIKKIIGPLFYDQKIGEHQDRIKDIRIDPSNGQVDLRFYADADYGDLEAIQTQSFEQPARYTGLDDNHRASSVDYIKKGETTTGYFNTTKLTGVAIADDNSFLSRRKTSIESDFLRTDIGKKYAGKTSAELKASPKYHQDLADYRFHLQSKYLSTGVSDLKLALASQIKDPKISDRDLAKKAMDMIKQISHSDLNMVPHSDMLLEDEAVVELFMQQVRGVNVNFNADNPADIQVE